MPRTRPVIKDDVRHNMTFSKDLTSILLDIIDGNIDREDARVPSATDYIEISQDGVAYRLSWQRFLQLIAEQVNGTPPPALSAPTNSIAPIITGEARLGVLLTTQPGSWSGNPLPTITRQWSANDVPIPGATGLNYTPVQSDVGKVITVKETATNSQGTVSSTSQGTLAVVGALVADTTISVFSSMLDGAILAMGSPGVTFTGAHAGVSAKSTGEIYISDSTAFFASLPTVIPTSGLAYGFVLNPADYYNFDQYSTNMAAWWDVTDHRKMKIDESTATVQEWGCKIEPTRIAKNEQYPSKRPIRLLDSPLGVGHPSVTFDPADVNIYGLFFPDLPLSAGAQRLAFSSTTKMQTRWDNDYDPNILSQANITWPSMDMAANFTVAKPVVFVAIANKETNTITFRVNGVETDTASYGTKTLDYNAILACVFYADNAGFSNTSQLFCGTGLGNTFTWKGGGFRGDLFEIISLIEAIPTP